MSKPVQPPVKYTPEQEQMLIAMWGEGKTTNEIANAIGRPLTSVRNKVRSLQKQGVLALRESPIRKPADPNQPELISEPDQPNSDHKRTAGATSDPAVEQSLISDPLTHHSSPPEPPLAEDVLSHLAGAFELPLHIVQGLAGHFVGKTSDEFIAFTTQACEAFSRQGGRCYYLPDTVMLSVDDNPSGVVVSTGDVGQMVLICRAIAGMRMKMDHHTFVGVCKMVARQF